MKKEFAFGRCYEVEEFSRCRKCSVPISESQAQDQDSLCDLCFKKMLRKEDMNHDHLRDMEYQQRERYQEEREQDHYDICGGV